MNRKVPLHSADDIRHEQTRKNVRCRAWITPSREPGIEGQRLSGHVASISTSAIASPPADDRGGRDGYSAVGVAVALTIRWINSPNGPLHHNFRMGIRDRLLGRPLRPNPTARQAPQLAGPAASSLQASQEPNRSSRFRHRRHNVRQVSLPDCGYPNLSVRRSARGGREQLYSRRSISQSRWRFPRLPLGERWRH